MVNPPPDPNERRSRDRDLSFDEWVALIVVFLSVGTILWWGLGRGRVSNVPLWSQASEMLEEPIFDLEDEQVSPDTEEPEGFLFEEEEEETIARRPVRVETVRPEGGRPIVIAPLPVVPDGVEGATTAPVTEGEALPPLSIADVPQDYWAYSFIKNLYDNGYLPNLPEGQFQPDAPLTRAEFAALLSRALVEDGAATATTAGFTDVPATYWAQEAIQQVVAAGYMSGYPGNEFRPDEFVPRYQVMATLAAGLGLAIPADPPATLQPFADAANGLPEWAQGKVAAAVAANIAVNHPNADALRPAETATRAEIAVMIHQALVIQGKLEPIPAEG